MKKTKKQVVETSVAVNNNSPIHDYVHPDNQTQPFEMTPGFKPFIAMKKQATKTCKLVYMSQSLLQSELKSQT